MEFKQEHRKLFEENELIPMKKDTQLKLHIKDSAKKVIHGLGNLKALAKEDI